MRNNTRQIFERLSKGAFLSVDSTDTEVKHLYIDVEENFDYYYDYFKEIGFCLESGNGYFYFSRLNEAKQSVEQKLQSFAQWVDILDFLKTFDIAVSAGYQFRTSQIIERINLDVELRDKARKLFRDKNSNIDIVNKLVSELTNIGFAEMINELDQTYKITSAFHYAEDLVGLISIYNEEETPEI